MERLPINAIINATIWDKKSTWEKLVKDFHVRTWEAIARDGKHPKGAPQP